MKVVLVALLVACVQSQQPSSSVEDLQKVILSLVHNAQEQGDMIEDRIRMEGDSGVMQIRASTTGTAPYFGQTHAGRSVLSIHEHSNNIRTVGMGEVCAVMNGVHFCTRHNDYRLNMPHTTDKTYGAKEPIPFPLVPESVQKLPVEDQVQEMREYFKAWATQNSTHRDYKPYFKPVLCYMEGAWTIDEGNITESFFSDRHAIEANTWHELQKKFRYTAYTGTKNQLENFATLPKKIMDIKMVGGLSLPSVAQWNYDIKCHLLKSNLPLNRFRPIDDLSTRMRNREQTMAQYTMSRAARFQLDPFDDGKWNGEKTVAWGLLDRLMYEIPGKDNYGSVIRDKSWGETAQLLEKEAPINAAQYHRKYKAQHRGAMGLQSRRRGYADENLYVAFNTQDKIHGVEVQNCRNSDIKRSSDKATCSKYTAKVSYAFPLEIIYLTPLHSWNPYNIELKGDPKSTRGASVIEKGRNGGKSISKAYNGCHDRLHYITPDSFFSGTEVSSDAADTSKGAVGVLDKAGKLRFTRSSGTRIFLPDIKGVGVLRTRYPIAPIHDDGSVIMKELAALKQVVLRPNRYAHMFHELPQSGQPSSNDGKSESATVVLKTTGGNADHVHEIILTSDEVSMLMKDASKTVTKTTEMANTHNHIVTINYKPSGKPFRIKTCDGMANRCPDKHGSLLLLVKS